MSHIAYPQSLDLQSTQFVFQTIKDRTIIENKVEFTNSIWNLLGFLLKTVVGEKDKPDPVAGSTTPDNPFTHEEEAVLQNICNECTNMLENPITLEDPDPIAGFDISALLTFIPIIIQLLNKLGIFKKILNR